MPGRGGAGRAAVHSHEIAAGLVSRLGRVYVTRGEPIRHHLPGPDRDPADHPGEETAAEVDQRLRRHDPRILQRPAKDPPRPPPPEPAPDDEPPPF